MPTRLAIADRRAIAQRMRLRAGLAGALLLMGCAGWSARAQEPRSISISLSAEPPILSDSAIDRVPRDFAGVPSLIADDTFVPPLRWPIDPPIGYTGPSG